LSSKGKVPRRLCISSLLTKTRHPSSRSRALLSGLTHSGFPSATRNTLILQDIQATCYHAHQGDQESIKGSITTGIEYMDGQLVGVILEIVWPALRLRAALSCFFLFGNYRKCLTISALDDLQANIVIWDSFRLLRVDIFGYYFLFAKCGHVLSFPAGHLGQGDIAL